MSPEEESFNKKLQALTDSKEFPFDEANWEKAQNLMDSAKVITPFAKRFFIFAGVALLLISGLTYYAINQSALNQNHQLVNATKPVVNNVANESRITNTETIAESIKTMQVNDQLKSETNTVDQSIINKDNKSESVSIKASNENETRLIHIPKTKLKVNEVNKNDKQIIFPTIAKQKKNKAYLFFKSEDRKLEVTKVSTQNATMPQLLSNAASSEQSHIAEAVMLQTNDFKEITTTHTKPEITKNEAQNSLNTNANGSNAAGYKNSKVPILYPINTEKKWLSNKANSNSNYYLTALPIAFNNTIDSNVQTADWPIKEGLVMNIHSPQNLNDENRYKHDVALEAGTSYLFGWKDNAVRDANGFNPVIGINYSYQLSHRYALSFGLHYTSVGNIKYTDYTAKRVKYNFGEEIDYTTISAKGMYYLMLPLNLSYRANAKNEVGVGFNLGYLLDVNSNVATYSKKFNVTSPAINAKSNGYKGGFNPMDAQLALFYRRRLASRLSVRSEFIYGVLDIKNDKYFKPVSFDRNVGLKLTLVYDIFKK